LKTKLIKKTSKILKLTRTDPTPEPYRYAGLRPANKYYEKDPFPKRPYSLKPESEKKVRNSSLGFWTF
jgi:hypothetical protein